MNLYEGMFLLDNNVVREDWNNAKRVANGVLEKHGASITTSRRWAERSLAYTIKKFNRGTYLLTHFEADPDSIKIMRRDLELNESVLRYLILKAEEVPEGEQELHDAELSTDFTVPEPPEDHVVDSDTENEETGDLDIEGTSFDGEYSSSSSSSSSKPKPAEASATETEEKKDDAPADGVTESTEETTEAAASEEA